MYRIDGTYENISLKIDILCVCVCVSCTMIIHITFTESFFLSISFSSLLINNEHFRKRYNVAMLVLYGFCWKLKSPKQKSSNSVLKYFFYYSRACNGFNHFSFVRVLCELWGLFWMVKKGGKHNQICLNKGCFNGSKWVMMGF